MRRPQPIDTFADPIAQAARETEEAWERMRSLTSHQHQRAALAPLVPALERQPRLRLLYPFTSHDVVCFSESTRWPYACRRCPVIIPQPGGIYRVELRSKPSSNGFWLWRRNQWPYETVGEGDAEFVAQRAERYLPPDCAGAILGTEGDWKRLRRKSGHKSR